MVDDDEELLDCGGEGIGLQNDMSLGGTGAFRN